MLFRLTKYFSIYQWKSKELQKPAIYTQKNETSVKEVTFNVNKNKNLTFF